MHARSAQKAAAQALRQGAADQSASSEPFINGNHLMSRAELPSEKSLLSVLERIAQALESVAPPPVAAVGFDQADAYVWHPSKALTPVQNVNRVEMSLLKGVDRVRDMLVENTERFARGLPANNALLWGARGMGKSSLVKAAHAAVNAANGRASGRSSWSKSTARTSRRLPDLMTLVRGSDYRFIVFCDDLSFDAEDTTYKSLKAVLEGGIEGRPAERDLLRHLKPPPPDAARDDGQRTLDRDQSRRSGRGEGVAVGPIRTLARLSPLQPGRISRDGRGLCRRIFGITIDPDDTAARSAGMGRRPAAHAPAASPGSSCRILPGGSNVGVNTEPPRLISHAGGATPADQT